MRSLPLVLVLALMPELTTLQFETLDMLRLAAVPITRTLREFAEQEIRIPDGPKKDDPFRVSVQPFTGLLLDAIDSRRWPEIFVGGPSQTGKTLIGHVIPAIYAAAELRKNLVIAMPDMKMVNNKWKADFEKVFLAAPNLRALLPTAGPGSRGGQIKDTIELTNGATIKFMTAGGDDAARAGFTAEGGVYVTEAARFSDVSETSVESDKLDQLRARMQALGRRNRRLIVEGTLTTELELPYSARQHSTQSRIVTPCPHCRGWMTPEREHLIGWQDAPTELQAAEKAFWCCPLCGEEITADQRRAANLAAQLLHAGQAIDKEGEITGEPPETERLWFRWNMWNNLLLEAGDIAIDEWKQAKLDPDSDAWDNAEKRACQFVWATPHVPRTLIVNPLAVGDVSRRAADYPRGELPDDTRYVSLFCDVGMYELHWALIAGRATGGMHVGDYGTIAVLPRHDPDSTAAQRKQAVKIKLLSSLNELARRCKIGWSLNGSRRFPDRILVDAGYLGDVVHPWIHRCGSPFFAALGRGAGQLDGKKYLHPTKRTNEIREIGERYHIRRHGVWRSLYFVMDADHWKSEVHNALRVDEDEPGSISIFLDQQTNHKTFEKHLLAERLKQVTDRKNYTQEEWENPDGKPNHYFDAVYGGFVGLHHAGFRIVSPTAGGVSSVVPVATASSGSSPSGWFANRR
jgi:phage terminase large subunit GpA-like protein